MVNWTRLEERFPNCYPLVKQFAETYESKDVRKRNLLNDFVESQGQKGYPMFIYGLRKIEANLEEKAKQEAEKVNS